MDLDYCRDAPLSRWLIEGIRRFAAVAVAGNRREALLRTAVASLP